MLIFAKSEAGHLVDLLIFPPLLVGAMQEFGPDVQASLFDGTRNCEHGDVWVAIKSAQATITSMHTKALRLIVFFLGSEVYISKIPI